MTDHPILYLLTRFLLPVSIILTAYLYCYPLANGCAFPSPRDFSHDGRQDFCILDTNPFESPVRGAAEPKFLPPEVPPFRLLALGDPQLEGDSSLPPLGFSDWQSLHAHLQEAQYIHAVFALGRGLKDIPVLCWHSLKYARKLIDLWGNDYYLAHIYRSLAFFTAPTHVTVLGDLLGSQWVDDDEFERRSRRFWTTVFRGAERVPPERLGASTDGDERIRTHTEQLGADVAWGTRLINVVGNHDIGYAGDLNAERIARFQREFGPINGDVMFNLNITTDSGETPSLRILLLNDMNIDGPAHDEDLQHDTYHFINSAIEHSLPVETHHHATFLLTHIPLHKEAGICVDEPFFDYYDEEHGSGVKEQNMISADMSKGAILQGLFGKTPDIEAPARGQGRDGIILTGHDHAGCDVYHYVNRSTGEWKAARWYSAEAAAQRRNKDVPGIREVTVRSMMGEYGGNAALVSAWWDARQQRWRIEVSNCVLGVQHIWWLAHILDLITIIVCIASVKEYLKHIRAEGSCGKASARKEGIAEVETRRLNSAEKQLAAGAGFLANGSVHRPTKGRSKKA